MINLEGFGPGGISKWVHFDQEHFAEAGTASQEIFVL